MRKVDDKNRPYISIEIFTDYDGKSTLEQAYHRFNEDCTEQEAEIIKEYCHRHKIDTSNFHFDRTIDLGEFY